MDGLQRHPRAQLWGSLLTHFSFHLLPIVVWPNHSLKNILPSGHFDKFPVAINISSFGDRLFTTCNVHLRSNNLLYWSPLPFFRTFLSVRPLAISLIDILSSFAIRVSIHILQVNYWSILKEQFFHDLNFLARSGSLTVPLHQFIALLG